jgi:hypothetical protein
VNVVGHDEESVELETTFRALLIQDFDEEFGVPLDLEDSTARGGGARNEVGAEFLRGERHKWVYAGV